MPLSSGIKRLFAEQIYYLGVLQCDSPRLAQLPYDLVSTITTNPQFILGSTTTGCWSDSRLLPCITYLRRGRHDQASPDSPHASRKAHQQSSIGLRKTLAVCASIPTVAWLAQLV